MRIFLQLEDTASHNFFYLWSRTQTSIQYGRLLYWEWPGSLQLWGTDKTTEGTGGGGDVHTVRWTWDWQHFSFGQEQPLWHKLLHTAETKSAYTKCTTAFPNSGGNKRHTLYYSEAKLFVATSVTKHFVRQVSSKHTLSPIQERTCLSATSVTKHFLSQVSSKPCHPCKAHKESLISCTDKGYRIELISPESPSRWALLTA